MLTVGRSSVFLTKRLGGITHEIFPLVINVHSLLTFIVITTFTLTPSFAFAQSAEEDEPATQRVTSESALDEIIVTARKRGEERLQEIPATISTFGADLLQRMGVSDFDDFAYQVPGLTFNDIGPSQKRYILRGVQSQGQQQVAVYFDEVPLPSIQDEASDSGSQTTDLKLYDFGTSRSSQRPSGYSIRGQFPDRHRTPHFQQA